jgi:polar amino acid transport system substrate-binding protein
LSGTEPEAPTLYPDETIFEMIVRSRLANSMRVYKALIISTILTTCVGIDSVAAERVVRVAGDPYPPWIEGTEGSVATEGIAVKLAQELFKRLNLKTLIVVYPFERGIQRIKEGDEDVILMVSETEERKKFILFTPPIRHSKWVFYHRKGDDFSWNTWKDLQKYRIGYVTGNNIGQDFPAAAEKYKFYIEEVKADIFNVKKLLLGRIDIIIADLEVMQRIIQQNLDFQGKLEWYDKPIFESYYHFGISRKSFLAPMLPEINEVLQKMKRDGAFQEIFCQYEKTYQGSCESK